MYVCIYVYLYVCMYAWKTAASWRWWADGWNVLGAVFFFVLKKRLAFCCHQLMCFVSKKIRAFNETSHGNSTKKWRNVYQISQSFREMSRNFREISRNFHEIAWNFCETLQTCAGVEQLRILDSNAFRVRVCVCVAWNAKPTEPDVQYECHTSTCCNEL